MESTLVSLSSLDEKHDGSQPKNSKIYKPIDLIKHNLVKQIQNMIYDKGSIHICCS